MIACADKYGRTLFYFLGMTGNVLGFDAVIKFHQQRQIGLASIAVNDTSANVGLDANHIATNGDDPKPLHHVGVTNYGFPSEDAIDPRLAEHIPLVVFVDPTLGPEGQSVESSAGNAVETKFTTMSNKDRAPTWVKSSTSSRVWYYILLVIFIAPIIAAFVVLVGIILLVLWCCKVGCFKEKKTKQEPVSQELQSQEYKATAGP